MHRKAGTVLALLLTGCTAGMQDAAQRPYPGEPRTTFEKHLRLAIEGQAESQNLVGYLLYFGEGVESGAGAAHEWFHRAARQGLPAALINLAVLHATDTGSLRDPREARRWYAEARRRLGNEIPATIGALVQSARRADDEPASAGRQPFESFCAGCHGTDGVAAFVDAPSFVLGERMEKSDGALLRAIHRGHGSMPSWEDKLSREMLQAALGHARGLRSRFVREGIARVSRESTARYYLFDAMERRSNARSGVSNE